MDILIGHRVRIHRWQVNGLVVSIDDLRDRPIKVLIEDAHGGSVYCRGNQLSILPGGYAIANAMLSNDE
jgi:hypothetical protein